MEFENITKVDLDPRQIIIEKYKKHIRETRLKDELYKWRLLSQYRGRPNLKAENFNEEISKTKFDNLVFSRFYGVMKQLSQSCSTQYKECLSALFDETTDLRERIIKFDSTIEILYRSLAEKHQHHHDERTISTLLTFQYPDKYTFYKSSYYSKFCEQLNIKTQNKGESYIHYLELIREFIEEFINSDNELIELVGEIIPADYFQDKNHLLLAQDILFQNFDLRIGSQRNYWRIGTTSREVSHWNKMKINKYVGIGWKELGDLYECKISTKEDVKDLMTKKAEEYPEKGIFPGDKANITKKSGEVYHFFKEIKNGDIVVAQDGKSILGIGVIEDEYYFNKDDEFGHQRAVLWKVIEPELKNTEGLQTTVFKLENITLINKIENLINNIPESNNDHMNTSLNQILYGPPGTGKTFNTINKAIGIINPTFDLEQDRKIVKAEFERLLKEGQIVFTTFHQSMNYEDFIEGIKPSVIDDKVIYETKPGIFKKLCEKAQTKLITKDNFDEIFEKFIKEINENGGSLVLETLVHSKEFTVYENSKKNLRFHANTEKAYEGVVRKEIIEHYLKTGETLDWSSYTKSIGEYLVKKYGYKREEKVELKNYVLIIDEINRGNVSQIFGELITLIEEDKRLGKAEELQVTLPYSDKPFGVPANLYIIGTMNTADRSVEALDAALRRRFSFEEMTPKSNLIATKGKLENGILKGIQLPKLLDTINIRIEKLLDKDHQIGHSYFIQVANIEDLKSAFQNKIIPLLQEYFFGDYGKIGLVLGKGFFVEPKSNDANIFANFYDYDAPDYSDKTIYRFKDISNMNDDDFIKAINELGII